MSMIPLTTVDVTAAGGDAYPSTPQIALEFQPDFFAFLNVSTDSATVIFVSFDGKTDHLSFTKGTPTEGLSVQVQYRKVWVRRNNPISGSAFLRVMGGSVE